MGSADESWTCHVLDTPANERSIIRRGMVDGQNGFMAIVAPIAVLNVSENPAHPGFHKSSLDSNIAREGTEAIKASL